MRWWGGIWGGCACALVAIMGCDRGATAEAPVQLAERAETHAGSAEQTATDIGRKEEVDQEGLLIGEYRLADNPVVDGDTIRVESVDGSIRLLSIDTEEKLRGKADRAAAAKDFEQYLKKKRGEATRPQKAGTPMGEEASKFAKAFFDGAETVRLERDDPKEIRGHYGRLLAYAFVEKNGRWTSYNVECVRAGMSPYFTKYGYSHRFHNQLAHAEIEARQAKRGIWDPDAQGYGDYDERKAWWNARAEFIRAFEHEANRRNDYVSTLPLGCIRTARGETRPRGLRALEPREDSALQGARASLVGKAAWKRVSCDLLRQRRLWRERNRALQARAREGPRHRRTLRKGRLPHASNRGRRACSRRAALVALTG